ncbi:MAG: ferritin-like domain-containing protein [Armatimonadota bacterium]
MSIRYSADEVLEMALEIERKGARFYQRAAELAADEKTKAMYLELAGMEQDHERTFAGMRSGLSAEERQEMTYDPEGQLPLYLQVMADKAMWQQRADPASALSGKASNEEVLRFAMGLEKDSIVFYLGLEELVPERLGGPRVEQIIKEEMSHLTTLSDLLRCARES